MTTVQDRIELNRERPGPLKDAMQAVQTAAQELDQIRRAIVAGDTSIGVGQFVIAEAAVRVADLRLEGARLAADRADEARAAAQRAQVAAQAARARVQAEALQRADELRAIDSGLAETHWQGLAALGSPAARQNLEKVRAFKESGSRAWSGYTP